MTDRLCVVQTLKTGALSQIVGYNFNSIARCHSDVIAAAEDGLFLLGGDTFNSVVIPAYFEFSVDLGQVTQINQAFIGLETDGKLQISFTADERIVNLETYIIDPAEINHDQHTVSVDVGTDVYGRFITIRIDNILGCDFSIDSIDLVTTPLGRWRVW